MRQTSARPFGSNMMNRMIANPNTNSLNGAIVIAIFEAVPMFIRYWVKALSDSFNPTMKIVPNTDPGIFPRPPIIIMAIYSMESHRLNGSGVMLMV